MSCALHRLWLPCWVGRIDLNAAGTDRCMVEARAVDRLLRLLAGTLVGRGLNENHQKPPGWLADMAGGGAAHWCVELPACKQCILTESVRYLVRCVRCRLDWRWLRMPTCPRCRLTPHLQSYLDGRQGTARPAAAPAPGNVPRDVFVSAKLAPKLGQQLKDVISICGGSLPSWWALCWRLWCSFPKCVL